MNLKFNDINTEALFKEIRNGSSLFMEDLFEYKFIKNSFEKNEVFHYDTYTVNYSSIRAKRNSEIRIVNHFKDDKVFVGITFYTFIDDDDRFKSLSLSDYFKTELKKEDWFEILNLNKYEGVTLETKITNFFKWLDIALDERLKNIINGKDWIDIPFDWQDYK